MFHSCSFTGDVHVLINSATADMCSVQVIIFATIYDFGSRVSLNYYLVVSLVVLCFGWLGVVQCHSLVNDTCIGAGQTAVHESVGVTAVGRRRLHCSLRRLHCTLQTAASFSVSLCYFKSRLVPRAAVLIPRPGASILRGIGRAISQILKIGGWRISHFGLHIFDRLLLVVALGIPVMPVVNKDYLKLVLLYVYVNST